MGYVLSREMIELSEAALLALDRIFSRKLQKSADGLDLIATSLSAHIPIFGMRLRDGELIPLTEQDFSQGAFRGGATRFEYRNGNDSVNVLAVRKADLEALLGRLAGKPVH